VRNGLHHDITGHGRRTDDALQAVRSLVERKKMSAIDCVAYAALKAEALDAG